MIWCYKIWIWSVLQHHPHHILGQYLHCVQFALLYLRSIDDMLQSAYHLQSRPCAFGLSASEAWNASSPSKHSKSVVINAAGLRRGHRGLVTDKCPVLLGSSSRLTERDYLLPDIFPVSSHIHKSLNAGLRSVTKEEFIISILWVLHMHSFICLVLTLHASSVITELNHSPQSL